MTAQMNNTESPKDNTEKQNFSADVSRLLDIVANALYTNHDVFLRELISNAADACDRLRYEAIQNPELTSDNPDFRIHVYKDTNTRTFHVIDNGIGMNAEELAENLGTIAKSGTASIMEKMKNSTSTDGADPLKLIGQFGVGFYAAYMIGHRIQVISSKAGEDITWHWESDGRTGFTVREATKDEAATLDGKRGTSIIIDVKDEASDFLLDEKIKMTVQTYSDHISVPIYLGTPFNTGNDDSEKLNTASALWMRPKNEITDEQYTEFYRHLTGGFDEPLVNCHWRAEGKIEYTSLLYIPTLRPWDLFDPSRRHFVKLYVRRVFISEDVETLMYPWLRFVRGIIDSEDLPLNISRESLQFNPVINKIRTSVARKILGDLDKLSRNESAKFASFWGQFGSVVKEGLYDAPELRTEILKICRFFSSKEDGEKLHSLKDYVERMHEKQEKIYYISGESLHSIQNSPQLEGFKSRGIEVLFLTDTIDDFWLQQVLDYDGKPFQSITKGNIDLSAFDDEESKDQSDEPEKQADTSQSEEEKEDLEAFLKQVFEVLQDKIHNVRKSQRLTSSPVCLVAADESVDMHMERVLKIHQKYENQVKPILEVNTKHPLLQIMAKLHKDGKTTDEEINLLYDQAKIIQGEPLDNPSEFSKRISEIMLKALSE